MLLLLSIAGAAALAVIAYTQLRARSPEAASTATRAVRELAAVVLILTKAVEGVVDTLTPPAPRTDRPRLVRGLQPGLFVDAWDDEEL